MTTPILIIVILVLSVLMLIAIFIIERSAKKSEKLIKRSNTILGLSQTNSPEQPFLDRIVNLFQRSDGRVAITNVFFDDRLDYRIYLFDLYHWSGNDDTPSVSSVVSVSSPYLNLPRFSLYSKSNVAGILGTALNKIIHYSASTEELTRVAVGSDPNFDRKYALYGFEIDAIKKTFSDQLLRRLGETENYMIEARGDTLALRRFDFEVERSRGDLSSDKIRGLLDDAVRLYELFKKSRT
jgi:hypothetical protein